MGILQEKGKPALIREVFKEIVITYLNPNAQMFWEQSKPWDQHKKHWHFCKMQSDRLVDMKNLITQYVVFKGKNILIEPQKNAENSVIIYGCSVSLDIDTYLRYQTFVHLLSVLLESFIVLILIILHQWKQSPVAEVLLSYKSNVYMFKFPYRHFASFLLLRTIMRDILHWILNKRDLGISLQTN